MTTTQDDDVILELRKWLKARNPKLTDADLGVDVDLVKSKTVDSLSALDFILFIEELSGQEIDTQAPDASTNLRTLRTIREAYFPARAEAKVGT